MEINVADPAMRSHAVTALSLGAHDGSRLRRWVQDNGGGTLGIGLGMSAPGDPNGDGFFRLGHMGHINAHMMLGALGVIESGLKALSIPHGDGALSAAAQVIAGA